MKKTFAYLLAVAAVFSGKVAVSAQDMVLKAGVFILRPGKVMRHTSILVKDGKVEAFGKDLKPPKGVKVYDFDSFYVSPGWIDAWARPSTGTELRSLFAPWIPGIDAGDGVDTTAGIWREYLENGITSVVVAPDPSLVGGGKAVLVKTGPRPRTAQRSMFFQVSLSKAARMRERPPTSIPGQVRLAREKMRDSGVEIPLIVYAENRFETVAAERLLESLGIEGFLAGTLEHRRIVEIAGSAAVKGLFLVMPTRKDPPWLLSRLKGLVRSGKPVAFCSGCPLRNPYSFRLSLARAVRYGVGEWKALEAVTTMPASMLDVGFRVGTLEKGRDADFIVSDGRPMNPLSSIIAVFVEGKPGFVKKGLEVRK